MRLGVDLGGSKIEAIALDNRGNTLARRRVPTPAGDYSATVIAIADLVASIEHELEQKGSVGLAAPGAISTRTGLIKNSNSTVLNGRPLDRDLAEKLGRPIRIENDANCFALSEAVDGAGANHRVVFGVILGTGVGGGVVVDRIPVSGRNRIAGEWGHNPLPWARDDERPGPTCYCGKSGCIETFLSGAGLSHDFRSRSGEELTAQDIAAAAASGDLHARASIDLYQDRLARGLASILNVLDPDIVVLGGGLSNIGQLYPRLAECMGKYVFSDAVDTPIVHAAHGDSSGVRGAAWLWPPNTNM